MSGTDQWVELRRTCSTDLLVGKEVASCGQCRDRSERRVTTFAENDETLPPRAMRFIVNELGP